MGNYKVESVFEHVGLKCVVIMTRLGHRCGYVGIPSDHPLYGLHYSDNSEYLKTSDMAEVEVEDAGFGQLLSAMMGKYQEDSVSPEMFFNVHGGITYSGDGEGMYPIESDLWWFGYDCAHAGDAKDLDVVDEKIKEIEMSYPTYGVLRTKEYCEDECRSFAEQLGKI